MILMSGISEIYITNNERLQNSPHLQKVKVLLSQIPSGVSVRTHEFFAPHLGNRKEIYIYENANSREGGSPAAQNADYVVIDQFLLGDSFQEHLIKLLDRGYEITTSNDGLTILTHSRKTL